MLNDVKLLVDVTDVNHYQMATTVDMRLDSYPQCFTIQLWEKEQNKRYIPLPGATVTIDFLRADDIRVSNTSPGPVTRTSQTVSKAATAIFAALTAGGQDDRSIWQVSLTQSDVAKLVTGGIRVTVIEGTKTTVIFLSGVTRVLPSSGGVV